MQETSEKSSAVTCRSDEIYKSLCCDYPTVGQVLKAISIRFENMDRMAHASVTPMTDICSDVVLRVSTTATSCFGKR